MRKFTLILSLLLLFVTAAMAQKYVVRESVTDVQSGNYVVYATSNINNSDTESTGPVQYNTYTDDSSAKYRMDADKTINVGDILQDGNYIWHIENNNGTITLQNLADNVYFVKDDGLNKNFSGTETANLILEKVSSDDSDKKFYLHLEDDAIGYIHCNSRSQDPCLSYWNSHAETGSCVRFEFYPVEIDLYTPYSTGARTTGASVQNYANRQITAVTVNNATTINNPSPTELYVDLTAESFTVMAGEDVKVTLTHNDVEWMHSFIYVDFDSNGFEYIDGDAVPLGDLVSYSYKHTDADGTNADIGHNSDGETIRSDSVINKIPSFEAPETPGTYRMRYKMAWDDFEPNGNAKWVSDAGTIIDFTLVVQSPALPAEAETLREKLDMLKVYNDTGLIGENIGQYSSDSFDDALATYEDGETFYRGITYETEVSAINEKITEIENLINSLKLNMPKSGGVYTFESVERGWWASGEAEYLYSTGSTGASVTTANASVNNEALQWIVYKGNNGLYLYNVAAGKFITLGTSDNNVPLAATPNNSTLAFKESTKDGYPYLVGLDNKVINLNIVNTDIFPYGGCLWSNGWTDNNEFSDPGSAVRITYVKDADEATLVTVAASVSSFEGTSYTLNVGATGFASLYLPYDVIVPDGVEAYIATSAGVGYVHMEQVTGVLPANTGAIVKADATDTSYDFIASAGLGMTPVVSGGAKIEDNLLLGTVYESPIEQEAYVLAAPNGSGSVAFYKAKMKEGSGMTFFNNKANRAYLPIDNLPAALQGSASFRFVFNNTTAVDELVEQRVENNDIYDLTGRRINEITKAGIYIIGGRKVFVK